MMEKLSDEGNIWKKNLFFERFVDHIEQNEFLSRNCIFH